jgi:hypothetical protein
LRSAPNASANRCGLIVPPSSSAKIKSRSLVGELTLTYEAMDLAANPGLTIAVYTAEPGSKSERALNRLASWTATADQSELAAAPEH